MEEVFDNLLRFIMPDADREYNMDRGFEAHFGQISGTGVGSGYFYGDERKKNAGPVHVST